jgi:hypothetical protein
VRAGERCSAYRGRDDDAKPLSAGLASDVRQMSDESLVYCSRGSYRYLSLHLRFCVESPVIRGLACLPSFVESSVSRGLASSSIRSLNIGIYAKSPLSPQKVFIFSSICVESSGVRRLDCFASFVESFVSRGLAFPNV